MKILVYVEHVDGQVGGMTGELLTLARTLATANGGTVEALVAAVEPASISGSMAGADLVLEATHPAFAQYDARNYGLLLRSVIEAHRPDLVLFGYTTSGLDLAPWLAARCGYAMAAYCTGAEVRDGKLCVQSQIYGGKLVADVTLDLPAIAMIAPGAVREADFGAATAARESVAIPADVGDDTVKVISVQIPDPNAIDISAVDKLVCVGRGIGEKDNIEEAQQLADALGAQLVSSRPLVDIGWFPKERQVGKSGRKVKPRLYLALGVSGAPEHLEGMATSDLIVAINTDANAPIFQVAHLGALSDCLDLIPELQKALEARGLAHG